MGVNVWICGSIIGTCTLSSHNKEVTRTEKFRITVAVIPPVCKFSLPPPFNWPATHYTRETEKGGISAEAKLGVKHKTRELCAGVIICRRKVITQEHVSRNRANSCLRSLFVEMIGVQVLVEIRGIASLGECIGGLEGPVIHLHKQRMAGSGLAPHLLFCGVLVTSRRCLHNNPGSVRRPKVLANDIDSQSSRYTNST